MQRYIIFIVFTFLLNSGFCQSAYYSTITSPILGDSARTEIGLFNFKDCTYQEVYVDTIKEFTKYVEWKDIAVCPDGELYGLGFDGIYVIDPTSQTHSKLIGPPPLDPRDKGIVCSKDSVLIYGEEEIYSYDLNSHLFTDHGSLPSIMSVWGDLFWINGRLMGSANNKIVQINVLDPSASQIYCTLPEFGFLSLFQVAISCDSVAIFAYYTSGDIYLINLNDCSKTFYCTIPHGIGETFQGSTPTSMFMPPLPCEIHLDLDSVDVTLPGNDYSDTIYCSLPHKLLLTIPDLFSNKQWDSLSVWIKQGSPGIFLDGNTPLFANLMGNQTDHLKYYRTALSEFKSLAPFLNEILLTGQMPDSISNLKIGFTAWAGSLQSDTAFAYITLINRTTSAGKDNFIKLCLSDIPIHLSMLLSNDATLGGQWKPSLSQSDLFQPKTDNPGEYSYVVNDPKCEPDTAEFLIETNPQIVFDLGLNRLICPGDTTEINLNLVNVEYLWSDGSSKSSISINEPQTVSVIITDDIGCTYGDSVEVVYDENCITEFYIPNIFSPDGNGLNDEWIINGGPGISLEINIFDRWGNMVFYQCGESIHWNGITRNNIKVQEGVYVYRLKILSGNHDAIVKTGDITLIR